MPPVRYPYGIQEALRGFSIVIAKPFGEIVGGWARIDSTKRYAHSVLPGLQLSAHHTGQDVIVIMPRKG